MAEAAPVYYISKVVLDNFKSYSGLTEIAAFRPGFTAIIGPNGCGKSNLMEAIVFALGCKSTSRSISTSEYIHRSSHSSTATYTTVSIHFRSPATNHETVVSRTVTANSSRFEIDGEQAKKKDVHRYCTTLGIDISSNRFSILQGEVQLLTTMPPTNGYRVDDGNLRKQGLLQYFDDLIGTKKYSQDLFDTESVITSLSEDVGQLVPIHDELQLKKIKMIPKLQLCFIYMRRILKRYLLLNFRLQVERCSEQQVLEKLCAKMRETDAERHKLSQEIEECERKLHIITKIVSKITEDIRKITFELTELKESEAGEDGLLAESKKMQTAREDVLRNLRFRRRKLIEGAAQFADIKDKYNAELTVLRQKIERTDSELAQIAGRLQETYSDPRMQQLMEELAPIMEEQRRIEQNLREMEREISNAREKLEENRRNRESARERFTENQAEISKLQAKLKTLEPEIASGRQVIANMQQSIRPLSAQSQALEARQQELADTISALEISMQKSQKRAAKQAEGNNFHSQLRKLIETKKIAGVLGRLGDLGEISAEMDVAVSTVFHNQLDSYVADDIEAAEELIDYVRRNRFGAVNVIVLDKIADINSHFSSPHSAVRRIFDLVRVNNPKAAKAFYYAFRDTLVAENIEIARKLAFEGKNRWNVVTLQGDLITRDGAMQGFAAVRRGAMRISGVGGSVEMRESEESLRQALQEKRKEMEVVESQRADLRKQIDLLVKKEQFERSEYTSKSFEKREILTQLQDLQHTVDLPPTTEMNPDNPFEEKIASLQPLINETDATLQSIMRQKERITTRLAKFKSPEVLELEKRQGLLKSDREFSEVEIIRTSGKLKANALEREKYEKEVKDLVDKIESFDIKLEELRLTISATEDRLNNSRKEIATRTAKQEELSVARRDNDRQRPVIEAELQRLKKNEDILEGRLLELKGDIKTKEEAVNRIRAEIAENRSEYHRTFTDFSAKVSDLQIDPELVRKRDEDSCHFSLEIEEKGSRVRYYRSIDEDFDASKVSLKSDVSRRIESLNYKLEASEDLHFLESFRSVSQELLNTAAELDRLYSELYTRRSQYEEVRQRRIAEFRIGCDHISRGLRAVYQLFTDTGLAEIEYFDAADPYLGGVYISVRPPEKSWKRMESLSGGERTLVALALIFAMHDYKPNGVYIMDEIDASLDFINAQKVAAYISKRKASAQFLIISLRSQMFEQADVLVGVYKPQDISLTVSIVPSACLSEDHSNPIISATAALS